MTRDEAKQVAMNWSKMNAEFFVNTLREDSSIQAALNVLQVASFLPDHEEVELRRELRRQGAK